MKFKPLDEQINLHRGRMQEVTKKGGKWHLSLPPPLSFTANPILIV